jgi:trk system potassium uptake protein TrkA
MTVTHDHTTGELRVVIAGAGRVGHRTAQVLSDLGHEVCLIERNTETVESVTGRRTGVVVEGDAADPTVLRQTDPERTDVLAALTGDGTTNIAVCAEMRHLASDVRTVARVDDPSQAEAPGEFVDEVVYPERAGSKAAVNRIQRDDVRALEDVAGDIDVLDVRIDPRAPVAGKRLDEVSLPEGSHVIADADGTEVARPGTTLDPDRRYLVAADPSVAADVRKLLIG